jgi:hypothetical protein
MKLKFRASQTTDKDPQAIKELILLKLKDKRYRILAVNDDSITFDDRSEELVTVFRGQRTGRFEEGTFQINRRDNSTIVVLNFSISPLILIMPGVFITTAAILGILENGSLEPALFFALALSLLIGIQITVLKAAANEMLDDILKSKQPVNN